MKSTIPRVPPHPAASIEGLPRRRDLLIEALHRLNDAHNGLDGDILRWIAKEFRVSEAEVFEVVAFYDHFSLNFSSAEPHFRIAPTSAAVCGHALPDHDREVIPASWLARNSTFDASAPQPPPLDSEKVLTDLAEAGLCGMGGAGFLTAVKWAAVQKRPGPRYVVVNADEGEPGAFKDRYLLERWPGQVLTGALLAAHVVGAERVYVYLRNEYSDLLAGLIGEAAALAPSWPGIEVEIRRGAGSYVCGEETALLESIEGRPALPRHKPPFPAERGLFGQPTLVNNVETLFWANEILARGARWFAEQGRRGAKGLRVFSVSGRVARPGAYVAPQGINLAELVDEYCGGMEVGHDLAAFLPGGASGGVLPARYADLPLNQAALEAVGAAPGCAAVIVLSHHDNLPQTLAELMSFLARESCGQCAPCRLGTWAAAQTLTATDASGPPALPALADAMALGSICGLGQGGGRLLQTYLRHFGEGVS